MFDSRDEEIIEDPSRAFLFEGRISIPTNGWERLADICFEKM
jgi:hypothetical protein